MTKNGNKPISILLILSLLASMIVSSCDISSKHLEKHYDENTNESIQNWDDIGVDGVITWDNATIQTFDDVDNYTDWAYSTILFSGITDDYPIIDCQVMDYRSNGNYFDGELIYEMVNDDFDVNTMVSQYAIGTGVIVVCVILHVATAGSSSVVACFFAGAADGAVSYAIKGQALGMAIGAVTTAIQTNGDWEAALYGSLEAGAQGYMWGAMWGAVTGGWNSAYCFTEDTSVSTDVGLVSISDITVGSKVLSYDCETDSYSYRTVTQINENTTNNLVRVSIGNDTIESTTNHPYLTNRGWVNASELIVGDTVISLSGPMIVSNVQMIELDEAIETYNLCVEDSHTYLVGESGVVVHNDCRTAPNQQYAGRRVHFDDPDWMADHPYKTPDEWRALAERYPNGIYFKPANANGISYPDFSEYAYEIVEFEYPSQAARAANTCLNGDWGHDSAMADRQIGINSSYRAENSLTWNHNENMTTLELIDRDIHDAVAHSGGASLLRAFFA